MADQSDEDGIGTAVGLVPGLNGWSAGAKGDWETDSPEGATDDWEGGIGSVGAWARSSCKVSLAQICPFWFKAVGWDTEERKRRP